MSQCLRLPVPLHLKLISIRSKKPTQHFMLGIRNSYVNPGNSHRLVAAVKEKLEKEYSSLPVGKNGRDDEEMILWFLKDRRFSVEDAVSKLTKAIRWRHEFGVSELSEESVKRVAESGKAYVHDYLDVYDRPVLIVDASKHFPGDMIEDQQLCVYMIEKALSKLPDGKQEILSIIDLREFRTQNADLNFISFVVINSNGSGTPGLKYLTNTFVYVQFDTFYCYYPKRLGQVLFVDAPFIFKPFWQLIKPLLKSYASLVKFCSADDVRKEYFAAGKRRYLKRATSMLLLQGAAWKHVKCKKNKN
ncbi:uncharacterized protein [Henckelia pumila]|uniref:uncharacterized protein isoform X2 n=1 Tax=Henckelia pumila TaxID=405737 RepID=UPI003C6E14D8